MEPEYFDDEFDLADKKDDLEDNPEKGRSGKKRVSKRKRRLSSMSYEERIAAHKRMVLLRILCGIGAAALIVILVCVVRNLIAYSSYKVINTEDRTAGTSVQYAEFYGKTLRYSKDGATFYQNKKKIIWNETYEMESPLLDICGRNMVIAERNGMKVCLFNLEGKTTEFEVTMPIKKVQISEQGTLVLLMEKNGEHFLQYYDGEGEMIAEGKAVFEKSGYPVDISLSDDGLKLAVSYLLVEDGITKSNVVFYSFASIGAAEIDNIVSEKKYDNTVIPTVYYADSKTAFAFGDHQLTVFKGSQRPEVLQEIRTEQEIQSIFYDEAYAGMVFKEDNGYRMEIYDTEGNKILDKAFDFQYEHIKISKDRIIMYNDKEWCIYTIGGRLKLKPCELSGPVSDIVALSKDRFLLVKANKTETVKMKL